MFALTEADRQITFVPRASIAKRYKDHDHYVKAIDKAARKLKKEGFL